MAIQRLLSTTTKNQLQLVALLMKGNQRLVLLLFLTFRVLWNPLREFWIATTLKLLKNFLRLWGIFLPNLRILSQKNNKLMPFILFLAMTVTTNTLEDQTSAWYTFERTSKSSFLLQKRKFSFIGAHIPNEPYNWGDNSKIITTNRRYHQRLCLEAWHINSTCAPLMMMAAYFLTPIYTLSEKKVAN